MAQLRPELQWFLPPGAGPCPLLVACAPVARAQGGWLRLAEALLAQGIGSLFPGQSEREWDVPAVAGLIGEARAHPAVNADYLCWLGCGSAADTLARDYFRLLPLGTPAAVALLSTRASEEELGHLTVPFLLVHGEADPLLREREHRSFEDAVLHHQMRYGDATTSLLYAGLGRELAAEPGGGLDGAVGEELARWLSSAVVETARGREGEARGLSFRRVVSRRELSPRGARAARAGGRGPRFLPRRAGSGR
jgi:hypothetical protein